MGACYAHMVRKYLEKIRQSKKQKEHIKKEQLRND